MEENDVLKKKRKKKNVQFKIQEGDDVHKAMKLFIVFERSDSGVLSFNEFKEAIREMGLDPSSDQLKRLFDRVDTDGNGKIDFEEFLKLFSQVGKKQEKGGNQDELNSEETKVFKLLKMFDADGDGTLSVAEWKHVLERMGMKTSTKEAKKLFRNVDSNGDGKIDLVELMNYLKK